MHNSLGINRNNKIMANTPIQVTTYLSEVLGKINQKLEKIEERLTKIEVGQARLEANVSILKEDVKEVKGSSQAQIWTLIGILGTAVIGTVIRFVILKCRVEDPRYIFRQNTHKN